MIEVDGSDGEGGGQILRTSLALSIITGKPLHMRRIRAGRPKPGLRRQHLACVQAAAALANAETRGAAVDSMSLEFVPHGIAETDLVIDIGSAGSTTLVIQTILVPTIVCARRALSATITGGTHNPMAPPFEFLDRVFMPHVVAMGADATLRCERFGFAPQGGGKLVLEVNHGAALRPIELVDAGAVVARRATAIVAGLPTHVGERELDVARARGFAGEVRTLDRGGPANVFVAEVELASGARELCSEIGEKRVRAEVVAGRALDAIDAYLAHGFPVGEHLADQLLLPMAIAGGGRFRSGPLSLHATTNIATIAKFLDVPIAVTAISGGVEVRVGA